MASVPPVEAPIAIILSSEIFFLSNILAVPLIFFKDATLAVAAIFNFVTSSFIKISTLFTDTSSGFVIKSTAPASIASNTALLIPLTIITGRGYWGISLLTNSIPSIFGISTSQVITSGSYASILSLASNGSEAVATTSIPGSAERPRVSISLDTILSSTIRTLIFLISIIPFYIQQA